MDKIRCLEIFPTSLDLVGTTTGDVFVNDIPYNNILTNKQLW